MTNEQAVRTDEVRHKVGKCPACRDYLWADVVVQSRVSAPTLQEDSHKPHVYASANSVAASVIHACDSREPAEWEREHLDMPSPPTQEHSPEQAPDEREGADDVA